MSLDTTNLTLQEKAELAQKLINEVIDATQTPKFENKSEEHKKATGVFRVFGDQFKSSVNMIVKNIKRAGD